MEKYRSTLGVPDGVIWGVREIISYSQVNCYKNYCSLATQVVVKSVAKIVLIQKKLRVCKRKFQEKKIFLFQRKTSVTTLSC